MKKIIVSTMVFMLSGLLTGTIFAAQKNEKTITSQTESQLVLKEKYLAKQEKHQAESKARKLQKAYFMKREAAKDLRDTAAELRQKNIATGNPGNTGM